MWRLFGKHMISSYSDDTKSRNFLVYFHYKNFTRILGKSSADLRRNCRSKTVSFTAIVGVVHHSLHGLHVPLIDDIHAQLLTTEAAIGSLECINNRQTYSIYFHTFTVWARILFCNTQKSMFRWELIGSVSCHTILNPLINVIVRDTHADNGPW